MQLVKQKQKNKMHIIIQKLIFHFRQLFKEI
jgi:hypothetical protein